MPTPTSEELECLEYYPGQAPNTCEGPVERRDALSPTGVRFPRCERHWEHRLKEQERIRETYPDSATPPGWFDPADAGERWDSDY